MSKEICIKPPPTMGDAILATALVEPLLSKAKKVVLITKPYICPLWKGIEGSQALTLNQVMDTWEIFNIEGYLGNQFDNPGKHLVNLQALEIKNQGGPEINPSPTEVKVILSEEEILTGARLIKEISWERGNLPVVVFEPFSSTKNRNIPLQTLQAVVNGLQRKAICCIEQPPDKGNLIKGAVTFWKNPRESAALLAAADAVVSVDSGPLHLVNGALQGSGNLLDKLGLNKNQGKVIIIVGPTPGESVAYDNNVVIAGTEGCDIVCRAIGYPGLEADKLSSYHNRSFYPSREDNSMCQFPNYADDETARCMASIPPKKIVEAVLETISAR